MPAVRVSARELAVGPRYVQIEVDGKKIDLRLAFSQDAVELNTDQPLPEKGEWRRTIAADRNDDPLLIYHAWALTENELVAYSRPVRAVITPRETAAAVTDPNSRLPVRFIRTHGSFDDFVNDASSAPVNPFTADDVASGEVPAYMIPYARIDFDEVCGPFVNDGGTAHQLGRGWMIGNCERVEGWRGECMHFGKEGSIEFKSKTWPHGAFTFSFRIRAGASGEVIGEDGDHWQEVTALPVRVGYTGDGRIFADREYNGERAHVESTAVLPAGWHHVAVVYDLSAVMLYVDGNKQASAPAQPTYQRTHSTPKLGFSRVTPAQKGNKDQCWFTGDLDQVEIIGAALDESAVRKLYSAGAWRAR